MTAAQPSSPTLRDFVRALFRHKGKALCTFCGVLGMVVAGILYWPREYRSEAKLFVRLGRESVTLDPTAAMGQTVPVTLTRETEINSLLEVLDSRALLEKVVDQLGPERVLNRGNSAAGSGASENPPMWAGVVHTLRELVSEPHPIGDHERAVNVLEDQVDIWSPKKTDIISLRCSAPSPQLAQLVLTTLLETYLDEHLRLNRTAGTYAFFAEQAELLHEQLEAKANELRDIRNAYKLGTVEAQRDILKASFSAIESELFQAQADLSAAEAKAAALSDALATLPERTLTDAVAGHPNAAADGMRQDLYKLEIQRAELISKYTAEHPLVRAIERQVAELKDGLAGQEATRTQTTQTSNPAFHQLQLEMLTEQSHAAASRARADALVAQHADLKERLYALNGQEIGIAEVERELALLDANYRMYAEQLEQARVADALARERISNINIVQPATFVAKPASPRKQLIAVAGVLFALSSALGVALVAERLDHSLKTAEEIERALALPVLATIPRMPRARVRLN